ncbi:hypothetical protein HUT19_41475 (plasmid) [Streptomyces sp. NA02950]|uniref:hypothetical protein n=1 Tax=Streptomyces sp. NA02950 TaxID=2742137 RepID=UPI0015903D39|nr:hypothetical protein [Streptomyces sp. NA02950]QKV98195.1 hypothetical protein HUT19_41475 [Streptomyces sp. NA02950]
MADREHGYAKYKREGCRCPICRAANAAYVANRQKQIILRRWQPYVDAEPVRTHVRGLMEAGMQRRHLATAACMSHGVLERLLYGRPSLGRAPSQQIRAHHARALLVLRADPAAPPSRIPIDATGSLRRVRALGAMGFPNAVLAGELDMHPMNFHTMLSQATVTVGMAQRVAALYDRAWNADPRAFGATARGITRTLARAAAAGWPSPLAWDDESIDDPAAVPDLGARATRTAALVEDISWLMETCGYTRQQAAERIGVTKAAVDQAFARANRRAEAA